MNDINSIMKERMESLRRENASLQRRVGMSQDQRDRAAIDTFTKHFKDHAEKNGIEMTGEAARREAEKIANRVDRKRDE